MTVPLLCPVPSCCRCFTLRTLSAWFLWLNVVFCGTGWASTSIDNFWQCFTIIDLLATTCSSQQHMLQATFHQVQLAEHTCRKSNYLLFHFSKYAASSNPWSKQRLPLRTVDMRALGVAIALDLTVRGTGYTYTPLHSPGDCIEVGVFTFLVLWLLLSRKLISNEFATLHFVYADRRATARTTTFVEPCSSQTKKTIHECVRSWFRWFSETCLNLLEVYSAEGTTVNQLVWSMYLKVLFQAWLVGAQERILSLIRWCFGSDARGIEFPMYHI